MLHPVLCVLAVKRKLALLLAGIHLDFQNVLSHGQDLSSQFLDLHLRIGIVLLPVSVTVLLLLLPKFIHILEVFSSQLKFLLQTVYLFAKFLGDAVCLVQSLSLTALFLSFSLDLGKKAMAVSAEHLIFFLDIGELLRK